MTWTLADFTHTVTRVIDEETSDQAYLIFIVDHDDENVAVETFYHGGRNHEPVIDAMLAGRHRFAAMATYVMWTPVYEEETKPSWALVSIKAGEPAEFLCKQWGTSTWYRLGRGQAPWFLLSSAGSLRKALVAGEPLAWRSVSEENRGLMDTPTGNPNPPTDDQGRL